VKKIILIGLVVFSLYSFKDDPKEKLVGTWVEFWGTGDNSSVKYHDTTFIILSANGEIIMKQINNKNYIYDKINFDGTYLYFTLVNTVDPNEIFYVLYKMKLSCDGNCLEGNITNSKNATDQVRWEKILGK